MEVSAAVPPAALPPAAPPPPALWPPALLPPDEDEEVDFVDVAAFGLLWAAAMTLEMQRTARRNRRAQGDETFIDSWPSWGFNGNRGFKSRPHGKATRPPFAERAWAAQRWKPSSLADTGTQLGGFP